jgi:hypothetical protein
LSEHLAAHLIGRYSRRELSPAELLRVDEHLSSCETCRANAEDPPRDGDILASLHANLQADRHAAEAEHLTYEQIAALVDDSLGAAERELAGAHLDLCQPCRAELDDLRAFHSSLAGSRSGLVSIGQRSALARQRPVFRHLFDVPFPLQLAAVTVLAVSLIGWAVWSRSARPAEGRQTDTTRSQPATSDPRSTPNSVASDVVVTLVDEGGTRVTLDTGGEIQGLDRLPSEAREAIKAAMRTGRLDMPADVVGLRGRAGTLMSGSGPAESFSVSSPLGTVVRSNRPVFRWTPLPGASRYTVTVLDETLRVVATSGPESATAWTPPTALERGRTFVWQVSALKDGKQIVSPAPPAPEARFRVLDAARNDELGRAEGIVGRSYLGRAVLYAGAGLIEDAERELRALVAANPNVAIAESLLQSLRNP